MTATNNYIQNSFIGSGGSLARRTAGTLNLSNNFLMPYQTYQVTSGTIATYSNNIVSGKRLITHPRRSGFIIPCVDDASNIAYAQSLESELRTRGLKGTYFSDYYGASISGLQAMSDSYNAYGNGMEIGGHGYSHSDLTATGNIYSITKAGYTINVDRAGNQIIIDGASPVTISSFKTKTLSAIRAELIAAGCTVGTVNSLVSQNTFGEVMADSSGAQASPYTPQLLIDTTGGTGYFKSEITDAKSAMESALTGYTAKSFATPYGSTNVNAQTAIKAAGFLGSRASGNEISLVSLNAYQQTYATMDGLNGLPITGATKTNPVVITSVNHRFQNGEVVEIKSVVGMTQLNGNTYTVANRTANTFELSGIDGTGFSTYTSGGSALNDRTIEEGARSLAEFVTEYGGIFYALSHNTAQFSIAQWQLWFNIIAQYPEVTVTSMGDAMNTIRNGGLWTTADNITWTRTYTDQFDFHLQSTSPAINTGTNVGLTSDYEGNTVPSGLLPDIGAYEFQDVSAPTGGSFTINSNATYTNSTAATLNITCPTDSWTPIQMAFGDDLNPTNWETCAGSKAWTLPTGDGTKTVHMRFRDGGLINTTSDTTDTIILDTTPPAVSDVTSTTANGSYKAGQTINVRATFSENVTITGTPRIKLQTDNGTDKYATYATGTGSQSIDFTYTVQAGDNSSDLDYFDINSLELNSGTIKDAATNDATLTLPSPGAAHSLGNNKAIVLDTTAPTITITNPNTNPAQSKTITASATESATLSYHINSSGVDTCDSSLAFTAYSSLTFSSESDNHKKVCYKAEDNVGNISYSLSGAISGIDTHAATLSNLEPNNTTFPVTTTSATLTLTTTETATCRYSTTSGIGYASMTAFDDVSPGTSHSAFVSGLASGTTYTYYIKCQDTAGNTSDESSLTFSIAPEENHISLSSVMVKIKRTWNKFKDTIHSSEKKLKLKQKDSQLANGTVKIYSDGQRIKTVSIDSSGFWDYILKLKDGADKLIKLKFFDSNGTLLDTQKATVKVDTEDPAFTVFPPDGKVLYTSYSSDMNRALGFLAKDNKEVSKYKIEWNGKIDTKKVYGKRPDQIQSYVIPKDTPTGSYTLKVTAYDEAGNKTKREGKVEVRVK